MLCLKGLGAARGAAGAAGAAAGRLEAKGLAGAEENGLALGGLGELDVNGLTEGVASGTEELVLPSPNSVLNLSRMSPVTPP